MYYEMPERQAKEKGGGLDNQSHLSAVSSSFPFEAQDLLEC